MWQHNLNIKEAKEKDKMKERVMFGYLKRKEACRRAVRNFLQEEKGASDIVAILLVIVILIAVAAIFREQLIKAVTGVFENLMEVLGID